MLMFLKIFLGYLLLIIFLVAIHHHLKKEQRRIAEAELEAISNWLEVKRKAKKLLDEMEAHPFGAQSQ